jgi:hypothetical protein
MYFNHVHPQYPHLSHTTFPLVPLSFLCLCYIVVVIFIITLGLNFTYEWKCDIWLISLNRIGDIVRRITVWAKPEKKVQDLIWKITTAKRPGVMAQMVELRYPNTYKRGAQSFPHTKKRCLKETEILITLISYTFKLQIIISYIINVYNFKMK